MSSRMTPTSARRFQASGVMNQASGMLSASATSSSRNAASDRAATCSPRHEFSVARHKRRTAAPLANRASLQSRRHLQRSRLPCSFGLEQFGQQESELDRLLGIEPRVAQRVIPVVQVLVADRAGAAGAFGDVLAGHLQMHAAAMRAFGRMHRKEGLHLLQDAIERARLVAALRRDRVAVHRIARPYRRLWLATFNRILLLDNL